MWIFPSFLLFLFVSQYTIGLQHYISSGMYSSDFNIFIYSPLKVIPRMSTFTLAFSFGHFWFTLINGPNCPGCYAILLFAASDFTSITHHIHNWVCFCFGSIPSFFLELFLHWSPVAYWAPTNLESFSFSIQSFCLFILFMWFSRQEYWSGLPFPSPVDHILSDLSTMTRPSWVAPHDIA